MKAKSFDIRISSTGKSPQRLLAEISKALWTYKLVYVDFPDDVMEAQIFGHGNWQGEAFLPRRNKIVCTPHGVHRKSACREDTMILIQQFLVDMSLLPDE